VITVRASLRAMPAVWFAIPVVVLAAFYGFALYPSDGYGLGATAMATGVLPFVGGFVAATAAWEGARLRRAVWRTPIVRSRLAVAGWVVLPSVAAGVVAVLAATAVLLSRSGTTVPDLRVLAVVLLDLVAWAAAGFALGVLLPPPVAIPAGVLLPFVWFAFVPAVYPVWLRHITGMFRDCCGLAEDIAGVALVASVLADLGILLGAAVAVGGRRSARRWLASAAALGLPVALALVIIRASGLGYSPTVPRDASLLDCRTDAGTTLCTWPEHVAIADEVLATAVSARQGWEAAGIESPSLVTEAGRSAAPAASIPVLLNGAAPDDVILALAGGLVPPVPDCEGGSTGGIATLWLEAWYAASGGVSQERLQEEFGGPEFMDGTTLDPVPTVDALRKASLEARRAWEAHARGMVITCDEVEQDLTVYP
jgi:hypothetical protein